MMLASGGTGDVPLFHWQGTDIDPKGPSSLEHYLPCITIADMESACNQISPTTTPLFIEARILAPTSPQKMTGTGTWSYRGS